ncbi:FtsB family cell division protein [Numidum massiliense]|uniref:FtsB family cell division protein n=1 Tax=Numidum massiliense TaxID=1522315 RepID=UPI0006D5A90E|nr:septum formation initiator family protein [Numidum massiliense]
MRKNRKRESSVVRFDPIANNNGGNSDRHKGNKGNRPSRERQATPPANVPLAKPKRGSGGAKRRLTVWLSVCVVFFAWAAIQLFVIEGNLAKSQEELVGAHEQLKRAKKHNEKLQEEVKLLKDPQYIAEYARKHLYMSGEGEIIFDYAP